MRTQCIIKYIQQGKPAKQLQGKQYNPTTVSNELNCYLKILLYIEA